MIITLNTPSQFMPGKLIVDKNKGIYGIVLRIENSNGSILNPIQTYKVKSLNISKYWLIRKLQLLIIKNAFQ